MPSDSGSALCGQFHDLRPMKELFQRSLAEVISGAKIQSVDRLSDGVGYRGRQTPPAVMAMAVGNRTEGGALGLATSPSTSYLAAAVSLIRNDTAP